jgi:hypothetical protein
MQERSVLDSLHTVEKQYLRGEYRNYFAVKRSNFFASIRGFPELWDCFLQLDEIWLREFSDLERITSTGQVLPLQLLMHCHAQFRIALELGFSTCLSEAWNILRSSMETAAVAYVICTNPPLTLLWAERSDGPQQKRAYKAAFEPEGKKSLFSATQTLRSLYEDYKDYSDHGTHPTMDAIALRNTTINTGKDQLWMINYLERDPKKLASVLFAMVKSSHLAEQVCFECFSSRLQLDDGLVRMRAQFDRTQSQAADALIKRYNIEQPEPPRIL